MAEEARNFQRLKKLQRQTSNTKCVDCYKKDPDCVSICFGVFVCTDCSLKHKRLKPDVQVSSIESWRNWSKIQLKMMEAGGNKSFIDYLALHGIQNHFDIIVKYHTPAAVVYRTRIEAMAEDHPWKDPLMNETDNPDGSGIPPLTRRFSEEDMSNVSEVVSPFCYTIKRKVDELYYGTASFSNCQKYFSFGVTIIEYKDETEAINCFGRWKRMRSNYITDVHHLDYQEKVTRIIAEEIDETLEVWLKRKVNQWTTSIGRPPCLDDKEKWWSFIRNDCVLIFRNVVKWLLYLYDQQLYHGNLMSGIVLTKELGAKLLLHSKNDIDFDSGCRKDVKRLEEINF